MAFFFLAFSPLVLPGYWGCHAGPSCVSRGKQPCRPLLSHHSSNLCYTQNPLGQGTPPNPHQPLHLLSFNKTAAQIHSTLAWFGWQHFGWSFLPQWVWVLASYESQLCVSHLVVSMLCYSGSGFACLLACLSPARSEFVLCCVCCRVPSAELRTLHEVWTQWIFVEG